MIMLRRSIVPSRRAGALSAVLAMLMACTTGGAGAFDTLTSVQPETAQTAGSRQRQPLMQLELARLRAGVHEAPWHLRLHERALLAAARDGDLDALRQALAAGANVNARDDYGNSALSLAVGREHFEMVHELLLKSANPNVKGAGGYTPLGHAAMRGHLPMVRGLLRAHAQVDVRSDNGGTALHNAALFGHVAAARELIRQGADAGLFNSEGQTAMGVASERGHARLIAAMLDERADPDLIDRNGRPPLYWALFRKRREVVELLLCRGADAGVMAVDIFEQPLAPCALQQANRN